MTVDLSKLEGREMKIKRSAPGRRESYAMDPRGPGTNRIRTQRQATGESKSGQLLETVGGIIEGFFGASADVKNHQAQIDHKVQILDNKKKVQEADKAASAAINEDRAGARQAALTGEGLDKFLTPEMQDMDGVRTRFMEQSGVVGVIEDRDQIESVARTGGREAVLELIEEQTKGGDPDFVDAYRSKALTYADAELYRVQSENRQMHQEKARENADISMTANLADPAFDGTIQSVEALVARQAAVFQMSGMSPTQARFEAEASYDRNVGTYVAESPNRSYLLFRKDQNRGGTSWAERYPNGFTKVMKEQNEKAQWPTTAKAWTEGQEILDATNRLGGITEREGEDVNTLVARARAYVEEHGENVFSGKFVPALSTAIGKQINLQANLDYMSKNGGIDPTAENNDDALYAADQANAAGQSSPGQDSAVAAHGPGKDGKSANTDAWTNGGDRTPLIQKLANYQQIMGEDFDITKHLSGEAAKEAAFALQMMESGQHSLPEINEMLANGEMANWNGHYGRSDTAPKPYAGAIANVADTIGLDVDDLSPDIRSEIVDTLDVYSAATAGQGLSPETIQGRVAKSLKGRINYYPTTDGTKPSIYSLPGNEKANPAQLDRNFEEVSNAFPRDSKPGAAVPDRLTEQGLGLALVNENGAQYVETPGARLIFTENNLPPGIDKIGYVVKDEETGLFEVTIRDPNLAKTGIDVEVSQGLWWAYRDGRWSLRLQGWDDSAPPKTAAQVEAERQARERDWDENLNFMGEGDLIGAENPYDRKSEGPKPKVQQKPFKESLDMDMGGHS